MKSAIEVRREKANEIHSGVINKGLQAAAVWGAGGVAGHFLATRYIPAYARGYRAYKLFVLCMIPTAAFFTVTDVEAMNADRRFAQEFSVTKSDELQAVKKSMTAEDWKKKFWENKNSIVGYTWLGLMSGSLIYNFRQKDINFTQKLINSRLIAQSGALLGIAALGIMAINMPKEETVVVDNILYTYSSSPRPPKPNELQYYNTKTKRKEAFPSLSDKSSVNLSVIVPAYNEIDRLEIMMDEALEYLKNSDYSYEIILVDDGSTDTTSELGLNIAKKHSKNGEIRVMTLKINRGKGGAVVQGMAVARGEYLLMVDADGATKFSDLDKLLEGIDGISKDGYGIAVGSRAHMVDTDAVVKRSAFRNFLMRGFHLLVYILGIQHIKDTQCGFKLFTREAAKKIVPNMHVEGWIFDIEMLIIADRNRIPVIEIPVTWHEVDGTKMNLLRDSVQMLIHLLMIRLNYLFRIWNDKKIIE
ncbi:dolichyl-phosphate beta-glucosyltransferase [Boothiomyces sp. JEL0866]|nr:dolichyl-phosphate beta-glucosyltransferase [Boothiomyces sp. JEL0866]